jgi:DNA-binding transcriptional LysR family regulator
VADAGQISEAARRLHLSQPAVTGQIRRLESNLERTLFIRTPRGVSLTSEGARLRERLQGVFAELEEIVLELDQKREVTGIVTIGASTTVARYFVPRIFVRFHHYHPTTTLKLVVGNTDAVLISSGNIGLVLVWLKDSPEARGYGWSHLSGMKSFRCVLPSGELGGLAGEFYRFASSMRDELIPTSAARQAVEQGNRE